MVWGTLVTFLANVVVDFIGITQLSTAYPNLVPRESIVVGDGEMAKDEGTDVEGLDGLADHEVLLVVGPDASPMMGPRTSNRLIYLVSSIL